MRNEKFQVYVHRKKISYTAALPYFLLSFFLLGDAAVPEFVRYFSEAAAGPEQILYVFKYS